MEQEIRLLQGQDVVAFTPEELVDLFNDNLTRSTTEGLVRKDLTDIWNLCSDEGLTLTEKISLFVCIFLGSLEKVVGPLANCPAKKLALQFYLKGKYKKGRSEASSSSSSSSASTSSSSSSAFPAQALPVLPTTPVTPSLEEAVLEELHKAATSPGAKGNYEVKAKKEQGYRRNGTGRVN